MTPEQIKELINRRRGQILFHSCLYYELDSNLITDHTYDRWAHELIELQKQYPEIAKECIYDKAFRNFNAGSGFNLPYRDYLCRCKGVLQFRRNNK